MYLGAQASTATAINERSNGIMEASGSEGHSMQELMAVASGGPSLHMWRERFLPGR